MTPKKNVLRIGKDNTLQNGVYRLTTGLLLLQFQRSAGPPSRYVLKPH